MALSSIHPLTATIQQVLTAHNIKNPLTGAQFTEAMLLGISGGLGAGYILWEFKKHESAIIVMGFSHRWNYTVAVITQLCQRLNMTTTFTETSGKKQAEAYFQAALATGKPFIAWVDKAHMPYLQLPEALKGYSGHLVTVLDADENSVRVADLGQEYIVPKDIFVAARAQIPSDKNRLLQLVPNGTAIDLAAAIQAGIADCIQHLSQPSESFSLPVLKKWAKLMTHPNDKKGWLTVFKERHGLYTTLRSIYEGITLDGVEGSGLRQLYSDFLVQSEIILGQTALNLAAVAYHQTAGVWRQLAETTLSDAVPAFKETKHLMQERYRLIGANDTAGLTRVMATLNDMEKRYNGAGFPLDDSATHRLFEAIQAALNAVYDAEVAALETLKAAQP